MKIIKASVYTTYTNEELICENVSEHYGKLIVDTVNKEGKGREWKFCLVPDDYEIRR
ncbi:hypothetical protein D1872_51150 [compost metagenome]